MAIFEDVEVQIVSTSTGLPLAEYDNPDPKTPTNGKEIQKYIEAVTNTEFKILVRLKKGFKYHGGDGVLINLRMDGNVLRRKKFDRKPHGTTATGLKKDIIIEKQDTLVGSGENWSRVSFSFGAADVDENLHLDKESFDEQLATLGRIKIGVGRVNSKPSKRMSGKGFKLQPTQGLPKGLLVKSLSHTFQPGTAKAAAAPSQFGTSESPIRGQFGKPFEYQFFYRSRAALQALGCLPSTPQPVPLAERSPSDMTNEEKAGQILQLRAENAARCDEIAIQRVEVQRLTQQAQEQAQEVQEARDLKAKMAAFVGSSAPATTAIPPFVNVKPERMKRERIDEASTPTRPARRPKPEYVDLD